MVVTVFGTYYVKYFKDTIYIIVKFMSHKQNNCINIFNYYYKALIKRLVKVRT